MNEQLMSPHEHTDCVFAGQPHFVRSSDVQPKRCVGFTVGSSVVGAFDGAVEGVNVVGTGTPAVATIPSRAWSSESMGAAK